MNSSQWMRSITEVPPAMRDITAQVMTAISAITGPLEGAIPPRGHAWKRALAGKPRRPRLGFGRAGGLDGSLPWRGQERQLEVVRQRSGASVFDLSVCGRPGVSEAAREGGETKTENRGVLRPSAKVG